MPNDQAAPSPSDYAGCRCFVSSTGLCGAALGVDGEHAGILYDVFASPREDIRAVYGLMDVVLQQGGNKLTVCESSLLTSFFEQFGFQAVCILERRGAPPNWIPDAGPDFVFMARKVYETSSAVFSWMSRVQDLPPASSRLDAPQLPCANCAARVENESHFDLFGGYRCMHCGFISVYGALTMGIPRFN